MAVSHIPVFLSLSVHQADPIGFGTIEDDELVIRVKHGPLVNALEHMIEAEHIKELYLGVGYPVNSTTIVRERPIT
jgi:hypothetical protein